MGKSQASDRHVLLGLLSLWLAACSLDSDLIGRHGSAAPVTTGVMLSGAGARDDDDPVVGYGESSRITDIGGASGDDGSRRASPNDMPGGTDSGGAFDERVGDISGAASSGSSADGAGGSHASGVAASGAAASGAAASDGAASGAAASDGAAGSSANEPPALWFSEYIEGSSSNKALEITAQMRSVLDGCRVSTYFNGKTEASVIATLSGVLEAGQVLTLCSSALKERLADVCNQVGNLTFNGDDVVTLSCDGEILDVLGQIGVDPGVAWGSDTNSTTDHTLRRKCSVQRGDPLGSDAFDPSPEWQSFPIDTFDGLGARGC